MNLLLTGPGCWVVLSPDYVSSLRLGSPEGRAVSPLVLGFFSLLLIFHALASGIPLPGSEVMPIKLMTESTRTQLSKCQDWDSVPCPGHPQTPNLPFIF